MTAALRLAHEATDKARAEVRQRDTLIAELRGEVETLRLGLANWSDRATQAEAALAEVREERDKLKGDNDYWREKARDYFGGLSESLKASRISDSEMMALLRRVNKEFERQVEQAEALNLQLVEALREIAKGEGAYSRDQLTHASNVIESMKALAESALKAAGGGE